ncbi:MAG: endonuclease III [Bacillota bacterium]|nr:endonuclease III [Bacillota bacterium]
MKPPIRAILDRLAARYPEAACGLRFADPFQLLVATLLSAQCTDARVNQVTARLFARAAHPRALLELPPQELEELLRPCGLHRTKAAHLREACRLLVEEHGGQVPETRRELERLPGVGHKTAGVVLANAFHQPVLPVDTHIFRVSHRLGLSSAPDPERTQEDLEALVPPEERVVAHHRFIALGRELCTARRPRCSACPLADLCPSAGLLSAEPGGTPGGGGIPTGNNGIPAGENEKS